MKYRITAQGADRTVEQVAENPAMMKKWLQAFKRNGWKINKVTEIRGTNAPSNTSNL